jgi:hypothetical protein
LLDPAGSSPRPGLVPVADYEVLLAASRRAYEKRRVADERARALDAHASWQEARLKDIERSASWRLTKPLRRAKRRLRRGGSRT